MSGAPRTPSAVGDLRALTPARVALGRTGASIPTAPLLSFTLAHGRARDAVHAGFDADALRADLSQRGMTTALAESLAPSRREFLARPDLGRHLSDESRDRVAKLAADRCDVAFVVGDGLSPAAVALRAPPVLGLLAQRLQAAALSCGPAIVATGARVALGDEIGALLRARMIVVLIGERPGLSSPLSLGAYITIDPRPGLTDADRNCVSNIHDAGLCNEEAAFKIAWLVREGLRRQVTGVALKDDSGKDEGPALAGASPG